jgi:hypothetical protein
MLEYFNYTSNIDIQENGLNEAFKNDSIERILCLTLTIVSIILGTPILYFIIWYEKYGSNQKSTLINMFITMNCWSFIGMSVFVQTSVMFRYIYGQLPVFICNLQSVLKYSVVSSILLNTNATNLAHYAYIF